MLLYEGAKGLTLQPLRPWTTKYHDSDPTGCGASWHACGDYAWRYRLATYASVRESRSLFLLSLQMTEAFYRQILARIKALTAQGNHVGAQALYVAYFKN
jgi:hypothetical protein